MKYLIEAKYASGILYDQRRKDGCDPIIAAHEYADLPTVDAIRVFGLPIVTVGDRRNNRGNGTVSAGFYLPDAIHRGIDLLSEGKPSVFRVINNVLKITRFEMMAMTGALRAPLSKITIPWLTSLSSTKSVAALYSNKGKGWELELLRLLKLRLPDAKITYIGSLRNGRSTDLLQAGDIIVETDIPIELW